MDKYKDMVEDLNKVAMGDLQKEGKVSPIAFIIKDEEILVPVLLSFHNDQDKQTGYTMVGVVAQYLSADTVILINDGAIREHTNKAAADYAALNYATENPLTYPESMRQDGIHFLSISLETRKIYGYFQSYKKIGEKDYNFSELCELGVGEGVLQESVFEGYNLSVEKEDVEKFIQDNRLEFKG